MKKYDLVIACGGTGGHVYPAVAIAEAIKKRHPDIRLLFVVKNGAFENRVFGNGNFDYKMIPAAGFSRVSMMKNLKLAWVLPLSIMKAFAIILAARPSAVLSTGGYTGLPLLLASILFRRKIFLQEQNTFPGLTTRMFASFASCIYLGYKEAAKHLPVSSRYMETGNPIRDNTGDTGANIREIHGIKMESRVVFVSGGSQGALAINKLIAAILAEIEKKGKIELIWQCGRANEEFALNVSRHFTSVHVVPFIDNIYDYYKAADLAICRSGAMTLSELARFGVPAILIPLPNSAGDHQRKNAIDVEARGGAVCFDQKETAVKLEKMICSLLEDTDALTVMKKNMTGMFKKDSANVIADDIRKELKI